MWRTPYLVQRPPPPTTPQAGFAIKGWLSSSPNRPSLLRHVLGPSTSLQEETPPFCFAGGENEGESGYKPCPRLHRLWTELRRKPGFMPPGIQLNNQTLHIFPKFSQDPTTTELQSNSKEDISTEKLELDSLRLFHSHCNTGRHNPKQPPPVWIYLSLWWQGLWRALQLSNRAEKTSTYFSCLTVWS